MSVSRKDDHLHYAKTLPQKGNAFADVKLIHHSIPSLNIDDIDLSVSFLNATFPVPFYINAMTGGNRAGDIINEKLAAIAHHFKLPFFVGSQSLMWKDPAVKGTYQKLRATYPDLFIVANVNPNATLTMAQEAVRALNANALAIHVNSLQELTMSEGDRDFRAWSTNIANIIKHLAVPVIIKEVGYGMHEVTLAHLESLGAQYVDISGAGGTNFTHIEMMRNGEKTNVLSEFGISTLDSLILARKYNFNVLASGGISSASDIIKALALGATSCGMARYFLDLSALSLEDAIAEVNKLISDLQKIMVVLNCPTIHDLNLNHVLL